MKLKLSTWIIGLIIPFFSHAQGDDPHTYRISSFGENQIINCTSTPVEIGVEIENWFSGFQYQWNDGSTDSFKLVSPNQTSVYQVTVSHDQFSLLEVKTFTVNVHNTPIEANNDEIIIDKFTCSGLDIELSAHHSGGHAPFFYNWSNGSSNPTAVVNPMNNETYNVTITDQCGSEAASQIEVLFEPHDELLFSDVSIDFTCDNKEVTLRPKVKKMKGGVGYGYRFTFGDWSEENAPIIVIPSEDKKIDFKITDACGVNVLDKTITFNKGAIEIPACEDETICNGAEVSITNLSDGLYYWNNGTMHASYSEVISKPTAFELQFLDECGDMHSMQKQFHLKEINSNFDYDIYQFDGTINLLPPAIESNDNLTWLLNGEVVSNELNPELELLAGVENEVELIVEDQDGCTSASQRTIVMRDGVDIPSAFSPNGDGLNDYFSVTFEEELDEFSIKIFDRWGQLIYNSRDQYFRWTGMLNNQSETLTSFAYILKATTVSGKQIEKRGTITAFDR